MVLLARLTQELADWEARIQTAPGDARLYVRRGMARFKLNQIEAAIADFDQAEILDPSLTPYLWQRGLAYYYGDRFEQGARQFEIDRQVNRRDMEETLWQCLCLARLKGWAEARRSLQPPNGDPRRIMVAIYDLFVGKLTPEAVLAIGQAEGYASQFYSHLYIGLFHEAANQPPLAQTFLTKAAYAFELDDYMWHLAHVHCQQRGWSPLA